MKRILSVLLVLALSLAGPVGAVSASATVIVDPLERVGEHSYAVFVRGHIVYFGDTDRLVILDMTDPTNPTLVGQTDPLEGTVSEVVVQGNYAYIANGSGVQVIDVSDPTSPEVVAGFGVPGAEGLAVVGSLLYVAAGANGLHAVDVSDLANPQILGSVDTPGSARRVAAGDGYAYIADSHGGLRVIDVSNPADLREVAHSTAEGQSVHNVLLRRDHAYVAYYHRDVGGGLAIVDVSVPENPSEIAFYYTEHWNGVDVAVQDTLGFVLSLGGVRVVDLSDPSDPNEIGSYYNYAGNAGIAVDGSYCYIASANEGLHIYRLLSDKITADIPPDGGIFTSTSGDATLEFPTGTFTNTVSITYRHLLDDKDTGSLIGIGQTFEITAVYTETGQPAQPAPGQSYTMTVAYGSRDTTGLIESTLAFYYWDGSQWVMEPSSVVDTANQTLTATPDHFSLWTVMGESWRVYLPVLHRFR